MSTHPLLMGHSDRRMDTQHTPQATRKPLTSTAGTAQVRGARCLVREVANWRAVR